MNSAHPPAPPISRRTLLGALSGVAATSLLPTGWASAQAAQQASAAPKLRLIGHTTLPYKLQFKDTTVGGLSGLDYDRERGVYYALSDDRSDINPARFYTLKLPLTADSLGTPELLSVTTLLAPDGKPYPNKRSVNTDNPNRNEVPDPESIRLRVATNTLYWSSEGDAARGTPAFVREQRLDGSYSSQVPVPAIFSFDSVGKKGLRDNKTLEGMGFTPSGDTLWVAMEAPLIQDGPLPTVAAVGGPIRLTQFASHSGQPFRQIAYIPDAIPAAPEVLGITVPVPQALADNGISEIWMASQTGMLVLERAWAYGVGNALRLYWIDTEDADDVLNVATLAGAKFKPAAKVLLLDFAQLGLPHLDNIEGMTRGPTLPNGNPTLVFVSDDNFSSSQVTQFVALEWTL